MKKIVELLIKKDDLELSELGVDTVSLVSSPAIGYEWFAFSEEGDDGADLEQFASYDDYPEYIKEAAQRAIDLNEKVDNKCMELTGKQRAQQLAQGKPISEETIRRMYSFLSRAEVYYDPSDTEACGTIAYLGWGGPGAREWAERKLAEIDREKLSKAIVLAAQEMGTEYDPETTTYLNEKDGKFDFADEPSVAGVLDAVKALDILSKRDSQEEAQIVYKYEGPIKSTSRDFCRAMVGLSRTKVFKREEIDRMATTAVNNGAVPKSGQAASTYDLFRFAAGANCGHRWVEYKMFKGSDNKTILIRTGVETTRGKDHGYGTGNMGGYSSRKALDNARQWAAINLSNQNFATVDEAQRIVVAPCMVPEVLIRRRNEMGEEYFVYFTKETIREIAEKFFKKNYHNNTDVNHDGNVSQANTLLESWIVEDPEKDKSAIYGFSVPKGTWMLSMRINDEETWNKIQSGELKGYSISGLFAEVPR